MKNAPMRPMNKVWLAHFLATVSYVGHIPFAPGTFGSLVGLGFLVAWFIGGATVFILGCMCAVCFVLGLWATQTVLVATSFRNTDPKEVVIDEVLGLWLTVFLMAFWVPLTWQALAVGFIAFRVFDIVKPFPIDYVDEKLAQLSQTAALGIMVDDCLAALFAAFWDVVIVRFLST
jgi:phosphatidylglycerophosphatase A